MPVYDYLCTACGPFTDMRPMADCDLSNDCPNCGRPAPRAFLTAPYLSGMAAERRLAHAVNERSASEPKLLSAAKQAHGAGCGCCSGKSLRATQRGKSGAKSFPTARPWMLSH
jgi:putative FmdB family regulatory protein